MSRTKTSSARVRKLNIKQKKRVIKNSKILPGSFRLFGRALKRIWRYKKTFGLLLVIYLALYLLLVRGIAGGFQLDEIRNEIESSAEGEGSVAKASALLGALVGSAGSVSSEASGVYQVILFVIMSLAIIWVLRQTYDGKMRISIGAVFYKSMQPLIQYILIWLLMLLQILPALIGVTLYGIVVGAGLASSVIENLLWVMFLGISFGTTIFLLSSSIIASYVVTLPGMTPIQSLRAARKLARFKRWMIIRKVIFLPLAFMFILLVFFLPLLLVAPVAAEAAFLIFMLVFMMIGHAYFYGIYRELL